MQSKYCIFVEYSDYVMDFMTSPKRRVGTAYRYHQILQWKYLVHNLMGITA